jgi:chitodextrinase
MNAAIVRCYAFCLFLTLLFLPIALNAECQISLTWDANSPVPDGYRLYQRESGESYNDHNYTDVGPSTQCSVSGLSESTTYHFVIRAYMGSEESGDSNEATYTCDSDSAGEPPAAPSNPPLQPEAISPSDNALDVDLQPTLGTSAFIDHDAGDYHAQTRWVIFRLDDDACVLDTTSTSALTSLKVPSSTLSPFTSYYWSVYYYDQNGDRSTPSRACDFTTRQITDEEPDDTSNNAQVALSTSGGGGGSSGSDSGIAGLGCFIQTLLNPR